jgi:omega-6 fatty acid desaturase (delta-12 desaturase)
MTPATDVRTRRSTGGRLISNRYGCAMPTPATPTPAEWRKILAPYSAPDLRRSALDVATSVVPYLALFALMVALLDVSYLLVLAVAVPASGFLVRIYILFHDCTHGSFLATKRANQRLGTVLGLLVFSNFMAWKHNHQIHHATAGDLERRGVGDLPTMTVAEYDAAPAKTRLAYRLYRNPVVLLGLGPLWSLVIQPRFADGKARPRIKRSVHLTNLALVAAVAAVCLVIGWQAFLLVQVPLIMMAGAVGVWLFYVQHQFEDAYWESGERWSYADAALEGSSHLKLPKVLQFFSGNIGLHHVHHLNARIPNYNLQRAHDENAIFQTVPELTLWDGIRSLHLKLWDEDANRLVTWAQARRSPAAAAAAPTASAAA